MLPNSLSVILPYPKHNYNLVVLFLTLILCFAPHTPPPTPKSGLITHQVHSFVFQNATGHILTLPACRRLLFPLLHACNKGNRRRLHAGKFSPGTSLTFQSVKFLATTRDLQVFFLRWLMLITRQIIVTRLSTDKMACEIVAISKRPLSTTFSLRLFPPTKIQITELFS